ncbi:hypothetical protein M422DRAFT_244012 [Sphaerobolus stellatus SS14]|nr:hypothetical protein M422DRAFT_244012 [Sphaerobolus stellatus SS14]
MSPVYDMRYVQGEENTTADTLSCMPNNTLSALYAACTLTYTHTPSSTIVAATTLDISIDSQHLTDIIEGHKKDDFTQQFMKDITTSSIEVNLSTGFSPFQLETSHSPQLIPPLILVDEVTLTPAEIDAQSIIDKLQTNIHEVQDSILAAKIVSDLVLLLTTNCHLNYMNNRKKHAVKFILCYDGPYSVTAAFPEKSEYTLCLLNNPKTFPRFHASLLKQFIPNDPTIFLDHNFTHPNTIITADGTKENYIDKIMNERRCGHSWQYLVYWVSYD